MDRQKTDGFDRVARFHRTVLRRVHGDLAGAVPEDEPRSGRGVVDGAGDMHELLRLFLQELGSGDDGGEETRVGIQRADSLDLAQAVDPEGEGLDLAGGILVVDLQAGGFHHQARQLRHGFFVGQEYGGIKDVPVRDQAEREMGRVGLGAPLDIATDAGALRLQFVESGVAIEEGHRWQRSSAKHGEVEGLDLVVSGIGDDARDMHPLAGVYWPDGGLAGGAEKYVTAVLQPEQTPTGIVEDDGCLVVDPVALPAFRFRQVPE